MTSRLAALLTLLTTLLLGPGALPVPPAGAAPIPVHDVLATSDPQEGDVLTSPPAKVTLVFSGEVKTLGAKVLVKASTGEVQEGAPTVDRQVVQQELRTGAPAGAYTVEWRVTSSDGHPVSGTLHFTVTGGAAPTTATGVPTTSTAAAVTPSTTDPGPSPTFAPSVSAPPSATPTTAGPAPEGEDRTGLWALLGGAALVLAGGVAYLLTRRR